MTEHIKRWLDEVALFITGGLAALGGWLVIVNTYLQTIAFIVSIAAGICAVLAYLDKRRARNESQESSGERPK